MSECPTEPAEGQSRMGGRSLRSGGCDAGACETLGAESVWTNVIVTTAAASAGSAVAVAETWQGIPDLHEFPVSDWPGNSWSQQGSADMPAQSIDCAIGHGSCAAAAGALRTPRNEVVSAISMTQRKSNPVAPRTRPQCANRELTTIKAEFPSSDGLLQRAHKSADGRRTPQWAEAAAIGRRAPIRCPPPG